MNQIIQGDCLEVMKGIPDKSVDMILCDLPYGTTTCRWDTVIPFEPLWAQYERIIKDDGAIALFGSQPFTSSLVNSNVKLYKYELIWFKNKPTGSALAKKRPMKTHENISIFYKNQPTYNPQKIARTEEELKRLSKKSVLTKGTDIQPIGGHTGNREDNKYKYPHSVLQYKSVPNTSKDPLVRTIHPTQKPVDLCEYLIKTYTNPEEIVLDNCIGSGTTAIAALNTGRFFIGIEQETKYVEIARQRLLDVAQ